MKLFTLAFEGRHVGTNGHEFIGPPAKLDEYVRAGEERERLVSTVV